MQSQLSEHINQFLSPFLYTKRWKDGKLFLLIERWKIMLHNKGYTDTVLMDLTKALNITNYELLTAKLHTWIQEGGTQINFKLLKTKKTKS